MKTNKKRNLKKAGFVAGVLCLASIGGVSAYLTDFDKAGQPVYRRQSFYRTGRTGI